MLDTSDAGGPPPKTFTTPESKRSRRKSLEVSPATFNTRSTSPRPSMERDNSSDESNPSKNGESTVYKGARRRASISVRDRDREDVGATDEESEAEDSETPWTCTLYVGPALPSAPPRVARGSVSEHSRMPTSGSMGVGLHSRVATMEETTVTTRSPGMRVKLGTMVPAPHHPKVVCQLKMPFPLPDVNIDQGRPVSPEDGPDDKGTRPHSQLHDKR